MRYRFGHFELDTEGFSLARAGVPVEIEPKVLDLLLLLLRHRGRVVAKEVVVSHLWPDATVGPESLRRLVKEARRAVADDGKRQDVIETVRSRGLRFVAPVEADEAEVANIFVGREQLLQHIDRDLEEVMGGRSRALLLRGEAGIGKTRAAQEIAERAGLRGFEVAGAWATEETGSGAYLPWTQVLGELADARDDIILRRHLAGAGPQLAEISPGLRERFPDLARLPELEAGHARTRLFDGFCSFFAHAAADRPLLLILDDLHAADLHSLELLRILMETVTSAPVCVVAAYRTEEMRRYPQRSQIIDAVEGGAVTAAVDLPRLTADEIERFVHRYTGHHPPEEVVSRLLHTTAGKPLLLTQTMHEIEGEEARDWVWAEALPVDVDGVIERHLARLSLPTRAVLRTAAVLGRDFEEDALARLHGSRSAVDAALREARSAHVVSASPSRAGASRFAHVLIRDALYAELRDAERLELHARAGASLEATAGHATEADSLAHHFFTAFAGGENDKASEYSELAGDQATRIYASKVAAGHYRNALVMVRSAEAADPMHVCRLLLKLGGAQRGNVEEDAARETYRQAADLARSNGLTRAFGEAVLGFSGLFIHMRTPEDETVALIEEAVMLLDDEEPALKAELLTRLSAEYCLHPDSGFVRSVRERALDALLASPAPDALLHLSTTTYSGILETLVPNSERAEFIERSLAECGENASHRMLLVARMRLAVEQLARGELVSHDEIVAATHRDAAENGDPYVKVLTRYHAQIRALIDGRFEDAERLSNEAVVYAQSHVDSAAARQVFVVQLGLLRVEQGRLSELISSIDLDADRSVDAARGSLTSQCLLALIATEVDARDQAAGLLDQIMRDLLPRDAGYHSWEAQCAVLAHICRELEAAAYAPELFELLSPLRGRVIARGHVGCHGPASLYLGLLADLMGRRAEAVTLLEEAMALAEKLNAAPWIARTHYCLGRALATSADAGEIAQAEFHAEQAKTLAERLGMLRIEAQAARLLTTLDAG